MQQTRLCISLLLLFFLFFLSHLLSSKDTAFNVFSLFSPFCLYLFTRTIFYLCIFLALFLSPIFISLPLSCSISFFAPFFCFANFFFCVYLFYFIFFLSHSHLCRDTFPFFLFFCISSYLYFSLSLSTCITHTLSLFFSPFSPLYHLLFFHSFSIFLLFFLSLPLHFSLYFSHFVLES